MSESGTTALTAAADRLRSLALAAAPGELLGSEESLIVRLGYSRSTVRQAARLLEREGLLRVRRGPSGGYFSARPDASTIERAVSAYLETLEMDTSDVTLIASALWVEAMRKAAGAEPEPRRALVERLRQRVHAIRDDAPFRQVLEIELLSQDEIFDLSRSGYIKLIFDINLEFARRNLTLTPRDEAGAPDPAFTREWRNAKLIELGAIAEGSRELAAIAGRYGRKIWSRKVGVRYAELQALGQAAA